MATTETTGARIGEQFLEGLRSDEREIYLEGERITDPSAHPKLEEPRSLADLRPPARGATFLMDRPTRANRSERHACPADGARRT